MIFRASILRSCINSIFINLSKCPGRGVHQICATDENRDIRALNLSERFSDLARSYGDKDKIVNIILEYTVAKDAGRRVPSTLVAEHMEELLSLPTKSQRIKYLNFLFKKECLKMGAARKKQQREESRRNQTPTVSSHIRYGQGGNSLFHNMAKSRIKKLYEHRVCHRMLFSQKIVIDLDYDDFMTKWESKNCAYQLSELNAANRVHADPFNLYFCNADHTKYTVQYLEKSLPKIWNDDSLITCCSTSYLDIFPKESLVYLSPHSDEVMECYDHDAVYIIGGFVDKANKVHASFEKSKREGIKSYRLPLDFYVQWKSGSKSLTLDQMVRILLEMKVSNDWKKAFQFLPERKVAQIDFEDVN